MLTLIEKTSRPKGKNQRGTWWLCQCDCGKKAIINYHELYSGDTKSCGCLKVRKPIYDKNKTEISNKAGIYGFQNIYIIDIATIKMIGQIIKKNNFIKQ